MREVIITETDNAYYVIEAVVDEETKYYGFDDVIRMLKKLTQYLLDRNDVKIVIARGDAQIDYLDQVLENLPVEVE